MVKFVVGEETRLQSAEERLFQNAARAEVGLVIGKLSSALDRGFVYDLVPTPPTDAGLPPCSLPDAGGGSEKKKGSKGGGGGRSSQPEAAGLPLSIDADWVTEHARQVSRMLLGGMHVVGIYVWASESSFKASNLVLWQTVKGVAQAAPFYDDDTQERLIVHASYSPRRWSCRNCMLTSNNVSTSLRPCDFKLGKLLASLQTFRCTYKFDIRMPIIGESNAGAFKDVLRDAIAYHAKELRNDTKALIDGKLVTEDLEYSADRIHEVKLLLPFMSDMHPEANRPGVVIGLLVFRGIICATAYLGPKDAVSDAIAEIKGDIICSLQSRLDIISEQAEGLMDSLANDTDSGQDTSAENVNCHHVLYNLKEHCTLLFPRRVLVPWLADVFICDYLQPSETFQDLKDHCKEMMSMEAPIDAKSILEVEKEGTALMIKSFWDAVLGKSAPQADRSGGNTGTELRVLPTELKGSNFFILVALAVLLISVVVGWFFMSK